MPILHVRKVPKSLYERLQERARQQDRSLSAEIIVLLERALAETEREQADLLDEIRLRRFFNPAEAGAADSTTLLRQYREQ